MARKTQVILTDDIDGSEATGTVSFGLDGVAYEIDLNDDNAQRMRDQLGEWASKARRVGGRRISGTRVRALQATLARFAPGRTRMATRSANGAVSPRRSATRTPRRTDHTGTSKSRSPP